MKRIALAVFLIIASGPAFTQTPQINNNGNGQNDCQCSGTGKPVDDPNHKEKKGAVTIQSDKVSIPGGLWYIYLEVYLKEMNINWHIKGN